jgi:4-hydroxy-4-methyl-2-oxoglutarate aldolase
MSLPDTDAERFALIETKLYTSVLGDVLDGLGRVHQFLPQSIQPIRTDLRLAGRALPVLCADVFGPQRNPFGRLTEALDALAPGEVFLGRTAKAECALWGEITTATAKARGAAGAVIDGFHWDTPKVLEQDWPVFSRGRYAQDSGNRSIVLDFGVPIEVDGVLVRPGDLVVGDLDGVLVIPAEVENEVLERALEKAAAENAVREAIEAGMSSTEAFRTYGVL